MDKNFNNGWNLDIEFPLVGREEKPRRNGLTMVLDKGLGLYESEDLLEIASEYIDFLKLSFGTSALYPKDLLKKKIELVKDYGVEIYPGGTFLEVAIIQNKWEEYLYKAKELGFNAIEVSDGTIDLPFDLRSSIIKKARKLEFTVFAEIGKKDKDEEFEVSQMIKQLKMDIADGADKVIVEARESGKGVSIYNESGEADEFKLQRLLLDSPHPTDIIWEAPLKKQQVYFINVLGNNVNLGNIDTRDILALESLRTGLRGDTFKKTLNLDSPDKTVIEIDV
ncbi:phosphosulfolactate synthase [Orenia metallireducens]|uniref:Phosphosulfolactate synthase n=1 Tax=Orenia metallireducens TaxID=1413210 RepID=A0A285H531_9FIRM|nr:phosphosulfolactate synthase [Orenia metallireducens]PRX29445.1 phosphosulfolactate synthase [Orenia metallireducens]SNY29886.1 phosphosulfolactate synthase [Orenia metallireducens]